MKGEPLKGWVWADDPFGDIAARIDGASFSALARTLFDQGTADSARTAIDAAYERCVRSRSARAESAPLLAAGIRHPDIGVRLTAATAIRDVAEAAAEAVESLAQQVADPPPAAFEDVGSLEARVFGAALEALIALGDPRWRRPFMTALVAGGITADALNLLIDTGVTADPELLAAVRRRLAALPPEGPAESGGYDAYLGRMQWHNEVNGLTRLLHLWGPVAAGAVPELVPLVLHDRGWTVRALAAIGPAASAAVPALTLVRDDPEAPWGRRLDCARALAAITGDTGQVSARIAEAAACGEPLPAARTAVEHELPIDNLLPALRDVAATSGGDDPSAIRRGRAARGRRPAAARTPGSRAVDRRAAAGPGRGRRPAAARASRTGQRRCRDTGRRLLRSAGPPGRGGTPPAPRHPARPRDLERETAPAAVDGGGVVPSGLVRCPIST
ncbi:hypothetical protein [Spirillospora sp. NPDC048819]|uniref:hypothetical protein n=1 Tax=Spirillospora sp. NPDC048819 TaxID=3155268 RepID=UPI0033DCA5DA